MEQISSVDLLRQLKREYDNDNVSALVGAGFSKNAIGGFPSWNELLLPIVKEMYKEEFDSLMRAHKKSKKNSADELYSQEKEACGAILLRYGNLEVVSEYIRRKGVGHESIDAYIEQYIKRAEVNGKGGWECNGVTYSKESLKTHEALLLCDKFRNFYTTNYDNLLEIAQKISDKTKRLRIVTSEARLYDTASNRAIIKLHGDIETSAEHQYEFDGDKNLKYIIAKEDYDTYMAKHQGFSYLMRLAMLQGRFCLIGFSGSDPNYMLWLQWMKDVMDKAQEIDTKNAPKEEQSIPEKRVYLISAQKYISNDATELFYKNHHVGVIDLTDKDVQTLLLGVKFDTIKGTSGRPTITNASELLQLFFAYLQHSDKKDESNKEDIITTVTENGDAQYLKLWREANEALSNHLDVKPIVDKIEKHYDSALNPMSIAWQDEAITYILHHMYSFEKDTKRLFALAVRDTGTLPSYYREVIKGMGGLADNLIWRKLSLRESILSGEAREEEVRKYGTILDLVMYYAILFKFDKMYQALNGWDATGDELPKKLFLLSLFKDREEDLPVWDSYISGQTNKQKKVNACSMRNIQSREYPPRYDLSAAKYNGFVTITEKIHSASTNIIQEKSNKSAYGVITKSFSFSGGGNNQPYTRSVRLLNLLYDNAYIPVYYSSGIIEEGDWYNVFSQLYEAYPYAIVYYSAFLRHDGLLRRMGQDLAYSHALYPTYTDDLLLKMLAALGNEHLPAGIRHGILVLTRELYIVVSPEKWTSLFIQNVFAPSLKHWETPISQSDDDVRNISVGLRYIYDTQLVNQLFIRLHKYMPYNPDVIIALCTRSLCLKLVQIDNKEVQSLIAQIVEQGNWEQYYALYYRLYRTLKLSAEQLNLIREKILTDDLSFAIKHTDVLFYLSRLAKTEAQRKMVSQLVMGLDNIWDCGVGEQARTAPSFVDITSFPEDWEWGATEMRVIIANMQQNITALLKSKDVVDNWLRSDYLLWLQQMILFAHRYGYWHTGKGKTLTKLLESVQERLYVNEKLEILLLSDDYYTLRYSSAMLEMELKEKAKGKELEDYRSEISVLLTRIMMFSGLEFQSLIGILYNLTSAYPEQMIKYYLDKIMYILEHSRQLDYQKLSLNMATTEITLHAIANILHKHGIRNETVQAWGLIRYNQGYDY